ncbi:MAG: hypothetical protein JWR68_2612 [Polaromonas sp.]|nr:hypothetical protein [Polaromonas sp.]
MVLFINHVLLQEKQAQDRLLRQKGRVVHLRWGLFAIDLIVTPAGLVNRAPSGAKPDLVLTVAAESIGAVLQAALAGKSPPVKIEGDVQLAAEIGWLAENLRWDAEEDLSRLVGDAPAHALASAGRKLASSLKEFLAKTPVSSSSQPAASSFSSSPTTAASTPMAVRTAEPTMPLKTPAHEPVTEFGDGAHQLNSAPTEESEQNALNSAGAPPLPKASA